MTPARFIFVLDMDNRISAPPRVKYCETFLCRLRGLAFRRPVTRDEGLLLVFGRDSRVDSSIHMLGVDFNLAVFWINDEMQVVDKTVAGAWKPAYLPKAPARYVLEVHASRIDDFEIGQTVQFQDA
ncbi:MAG: hypothetical protein JETCAE02_19690 [Anaerolineaceae bacterium]|jgi:uncharacterized membrane protein (UPF0127 family)|nr:hypothetical protein [Anaerolineae bacterium]MBL1171000.1 hypothetical protein [Chloroflexota bacterium]MBV6467360.1 hypothetical protein [Anaerolineales bacterium]MDL1925000.1 hypothetical protein [Anaerolineae bacterium AMX1]GER79940.1 conserved hypothetical protein [Candidatus Denitrolinea symbiosum]GJQ39557.1 MAG: hypothetical protein JETCAE02_19690 [Anaerolineaceae bacterium]